MDLKIILFNVYFYTLISINKEYKQESNMKKFDRKPNLCVISLIISARKNTIKNSINNT